MKTDFDKQDRIKVLSPDGFIIDFYNLTYPCKRSAIKAFTKWKGNYKTQGYYSSREYGRINLKDLIDYCRFEKA
jgi:hypothetical protein